MKLTNNTKTKVSITNQKEVQVKLLPGADMPITRDQANAIMRYITAFNLTLEETREEKAVKSRGGGPRKVSAPIIPGQEILEKEDRVPTEEHTGTHTLEELDDKTSAELREICRLSTPPMLTHGSRPTLIQRLLQISD